MEVPRVRHKNLTTAGRYVVFVLPKGFIERHGLTKDSEVVALVGKDEIVLIPPRVSRTKTAGNIAIDVNVLLIRLKEEFGVIQEEPKPFDPTVFDEETEGGDVVRCFGCKIGMVVQGKVIIDSLHCSVDGNDQVFCSGNCITKYSGENPKAVITVLDAPVGHPLAPKPLEDIEAQYTCTKCGAITKESDFHYKDGSLYLSLENTGLCENCNRGKST